MQKMGWLKPDNTDDTCLFVKYDHKQVDYQNRTNPNNHDWAKRCLQLIQDQLKNLEEQRKVKLRDITYLTGEVEKCKAAPQSVNDVMQDIIARFKKGIQERNSQLHELQTKEDELRAKLGEHQEMLERFAPENIAALQHQLENLENVFVDEMSTHAQQHFGAERFSFMEDQVKARREAAVSGKMTQEVPLLKNGGDAGPAASSEVAAEGGAGSATGGDAARLGTVQAGQGGVRTRSTRGPGNEPPPGTEMPLKRKASHPS
jgi:hypothetical protein